MTETDIMEQEIASRPEGTRDEDILWLCLELGWTYREVARALGVSPGIVSGVVRRHRAKQANRTLH